MLKDCAGLGEVGVGDVLARGWRRWVGRSRGFKRSRCFWVLGSWSGFLGSGFLGSGFWVLILILVLK